MKTKEQLAASSGGNRHANARAMAAYKKAEQPAAFKDFSARELYCPKCSVSMPVRERLLLVLPTGSLFDYVCSRCGTTVGTRKT